MFCAKCGAQIPEGARFCAKCGTLVVATATIPATGLTTVQPTQRTSGMATASLVCGIAGFFLGWILFVIPPILAIIFSLVSLPQFSKDPTLKGKGMAIAGLVLGIVGLAWVAFAFWIIWAFWGIFVV